MLWFVITCSVETFIFKMCFGHRTDKCTANEKINKLNGIEINYMELNENGVKVSR